MVDKAKYVVNGKVQRSKISSDVRYGILTRNDIISLTNDKEIKESFIGESFTKKAPKGEWTKDYIEQIVCMSVAECFNTDYLLHIFEVAEYLRHKKEKGKTMLQIGIGAALIAAIVVVYYAVKH